MSSYNGPSLTIVALAWREGEQLAKCFASLRPLLRITGADTLVLLDSQADLLTTDVAHWVANHVAVAHFDNFAAQRNRALALCSTEWVFFIDADERITPALAEEIVSVLEREQEAAYRVPRRNILFGHEVRHTGWSPDYQVRLLKRTACRYDEKRQVHEVPEVAGSTGTLREPLTHFNYTTWRQFIEKQRSYAPLEARAMYAEGRRARVRSLLGQPLREFKRRFIEFKGYRDGPLGFELSVAMAAYSLLAYWHLLRLQRSKSDRKPSHRPDEPSQNW